MNKAFLGQSYLYNTPMCGAQPVGVVEQAGRDGHTYYLVVWWYGNEPRRIVTPHCPPTTDCAAAQAALDKYAADRGLPAAAPAGGAA